MCGICGFTGEGGGKNAIQRMTDAMRHRGPDDGDIYMDDHVALGHRRLSILDLKHGHQPMLDAASGTVIVYNGEIYNHLEIRRHLEKLGHIFISGHSDTETLLKAFLQWGPDCFALLNGMFACAIYQPGQKKLWLARDRFGEKPLFYAVNGSRFAFASEISSLLHWPHFDKTLSKANIQRFFAWNYLPSGRTIYENCHSLQPATWLLADVENGVIQCRKYWKFELAPDESLTDGMEGALVEELRHLLVQAVRRRFLSDVPLGVFLSGGIDSSAILCAASRIYDPESIRTFTIGFRDKSFDESDKARCVAGFLKARNDVQYLTAEEMKQSVAAILCALSEPFGDASLIPSALLARFARKHVTVALSGDGGDELFGGYDPLAAVRPASFYRRMVPFWLHVLLRRMTGLVPASDKNMSLEFRIKRMLRGLSYSEAMQLPVWMSGLEPSEISEFFDDPLNAEELYADVLDLYKEYPGLNSLEQAFVFFTRLYLSDDILVKSDRASMMNSLETRAVFLDNDLVDFCSHLPMRFKYRNGQRKWLLKKALAGWLPDAILAQPKKGFGIPLNAWLRFLPEIDPEVPGLKAGIIAYCNGKHKKRSGDFRYFLWDIQSLARVLSLPADKL